MKNPHALANTLTAYALIAENSHIDDAVDQAVGAFASSVGVEYETAAERLG